jgi:hypothetical protein
VAGRPRLTTHTHHDEGAPVPGRGVFHVERLPPARAGEKLATAARLVLKKVAHAQTR